MSYEVKDSLIHFKSNKPLRLHNGIIGIDEEESKQCISDCIHIERHAKVRLNVMDQ